MTSSATESPSRQNTIPARSRVGLWLGPLVFLLMLAFVELDPGNPWLPEWRRSFSGWRSGG